MPAPFDVGEPWPFTLIQGDDWSESFQVLDDPDDDTSGVVLTGYTGKAQLRPRPGSSTLLLEFDVVVSQAGAGDPDAGLITVSADSVATGAVTKSGYWDLWLFSGGEGWPAIAPGKVTVQKRVTIP